MDGRRSKGQIESRELFPLVEREKSPGRDQEVNRKCPRTMRGEDIRGGPGTSEYTAQMSISGDRDVKKGGKKEKHAKSLASG